MAFARQTEIVAKADALASKLVTTKQKDHRNLEKQTCDCVGPEQQRAKGVSDCR